MSEPAEPGRGVLARIFKSIVQTCLVLALAVSLYLASALIGTVWTSAGHGTGGGQVTVYVLSNGFHSDIAVPLSDNRTLEAIPVRAADLPGGLQGTEYLVLGWGSETAYTSLLALSDLTPGIVARALLFDRSVMHVLPLAGRPGGNRAYRLDLDDTQYDQLLDFIAATFETDTAGQAVLLEGITQGFGDVFYRAGRRFSPFYGCNAWTGHALRRAGVPLGRWTPFAQSIEWNMEQLSMDSKNRS